MHQKQNEDKKMAKLTIDYASKENLTVYFSSAMSSFKAFFSVDEYKDVSMNGEIETPFIDVCVTVNPNAHVVLDSDGTDDSEFLLDVRLTDDMCRELARLIEKEI